MKDVMVDLETLGRRAGCQILSIGAVAFDALTNKLGNEFYCVVSMASQEATKLHIDSETVAWWEKQSPEARKVLDQARNVQLPNAGKVLPLGKALSSFATYLGDFGLKQVRVWGNGADFDNAILQCCYHEVGLSVPWTFTNNRCYRTLKALVGGVKAQRVGTYHNALDDAKTQALHAIQLLRS